MRRRPRRDDATVPDIASRDPCHRPVQAPRLRGAVLAWPLRRRKPLTARLRDVPGRDRSDPFGGTTRRTRLLARGSTRPVPEAANRHRIIVWLTLAMTSARRDARAARRGVWS